MSYIMNDQPSSYFGSILSTYLDFPDNKPITVIDFKSFDGSFLSKLTRNADERFLYGMEEDRYSVNKSASTFERISNAHYMSQSKITNDAFSMAVVNPIIHGSFFETHFSDYDPFKIPDFATEERERIYGIEQQKDELDLNDEDETEEQKQKRIESIDKKVAKAIEERNIAYRRALREQEKRTESYRSDKFLLASAIRYLMPRGILVMITPKEFIDGQIAFKLANNFEDIKIIRMEEDEYKYQRKCIIIARKRVKPERQDVLPYELMQYKYKPYREIESVSPQATPLYYVPSQSKEAIVNFRVGPVTMEECLKAMRTSPLIDNFSADQIQSTSKKTPKPPTQLHKGHVSLTLASGLLNGYIGTGADQHLVKGTVIKQKSTSTEQVDNEETGDSRSETVEREYFNVGIKYVDRNGKFVKLL